MLCSISTELSFNFLSCSGENPVEDDAWVNWIYTQPKPYAQGISKWVPPEWTAAPEFCNKLDAVNKKFVSMDNHPCNWMAWPDIVIS